MSTLIMSENRPQQIVDGDKWLTFRPFKPGDMFRQANAAMLLEDAVIAESGVAKWRVGGLVPVKPGRIQPTCLVEDRDSEVVRDLRRTYLRLHPRAELSGISQKELRDYLLHMDEGFSLLYVKVTALKRVDVREISDTDAVAAGFGDAYEYLKWWTQAYDVQAAREERKFYALHYGTMEHVTGWRDWLKQARPLAKYDAWRIQFVRHLP